MSVYTKTGDAGLSTVNFKRVSKSDIYFECLGELDTLNAYIGLIMAQQTISESSILNTLLQIQKNLISLGSHIAGYLPDITKFKEEIESLENSIDALDAQNKPLRNFILPNGCFSSVFMHLIRSNARKCERCIIKVQQEHGITFNVLAQQYLNRLSDYFFVLSRYLNAKGEGDIPM